MGPDRFVEQPRDLEPAQPVPSDVVTGRGRERWSIGNAVKGGLIVFAASFGLLEISGLVYQTISTGSTGPINELQKITSVSLELAAIYGLITGLSIAKSMATSRS